MTNTDYSRIIEAANTELDLPTGVCLNAFRGSLAHGMWLGSPDDPHGIDDIDLMGVVIGEPCHYLGLHEWSQRGTKEIKQGRWDLVLYDIRKMFSLLLQGNPNVLSLLWVRPQDYILLTAAGRRIVDNRHLFVGKHVYNSFAGYAHQQIVKMESRDPAELRDYLALTYEAKARGIHPNHKGEVIPYAADYDQTTGEARNAQAHSNDVLIAKLRHYMKKGDNLGYLGDKRKGLVLQHGYDSKNLSHSIRLMRMAIEFMQTGELTVFRPDADELIDIKRGLWTLERGKTHADELFAQMKDARDKSTLPAEPDSAAVDKLLVDILSEALCIG